MVYAKVDTEAEQGLAAAAEIRAIPTLMAFKKGKMVFNQAGVLPAGGAGGPGRSKIKEFDVDAAIAEDGKAEHASRRDADRTR